MRTYSGKGFKVINKPAAKVSNKPAVKQTHYCYSFADATTTASYLERLGKSYDIKKRTTEQQVTTHERRSLWPRRVPVVRNSWVPVWLIEEHE